MDFRAVTTDLSVEEIAGCYPWMGKIVLTHTQLDLQVARLVSTFANLHGSIVAKHLIYTIDAVSKNKILNAISSVFRSDPHGLVDGYEANPRLAKLFKELGEGFAEHSKIRNVVCHGTLGKVDGRLFMASAAAPQFFRNDGGVGGWVFFDKMTAYLDAMAVTLIAARDLELELRSAHRSD